MATVATDPTTMRWLRLGAAGLGPRLTLFALAAAGHLAFAWAMFGFSARELVPALALVSTNILALGWISLRRRRGPLSASAIVVALTVVGMALTVLVALGVSRVRYLDSPSGVDFFSVVVGSLFCGCIMGVMGATVAVPLGLAIDRWRDDPVPRRGLDAWATLACVGAVSYGITSFAGVTTERWNDSVLLAFMRTAADVALPVVSLLLALALWVAERHAHRDLAMLPFTAPAGYRWVDARHHEAVAPSWGLSEQPCTKALMRATESVGYREHSSTEVVAWWPDIEPRSWRDNALVGAMVVGALGVLIRLLR